MEVSAPPTFTGQVYKLVCDDGHYYIGSTKSELKYRLYHHKQHSLIFPDRKVYEHILNCGWNTVKIVCIEEVTSTLKDELRKKENEHIKKSLSDPLCLNMNKAHLTKEELLVQHKEYLEANKEKVDAYQAEYRQLNAEKRCEYSKQYAADHPEEVKAKQKAYYEENKTELIEKQKAYAAEHKDEIQRRKKEWAENNKEKVIASRNKYYEENKSLIQERAKEYYETNKDTIQEKLKIYRDARKDTSKEYGKKYREQHRTTLAESHTCECGGKYSWTHEERHKSSKRHLKFAQQ